jgi:hypothetical protein
VEVAVPEAGELLPADLQAQERTCALLQDNNFKTKVELYQAKIDYLHRDKNILDHFCEKMEFDHQATYLQDFSTLAISHEYDYRKLLVKVKDGERLPAGVAKELLLRASRQATNCQNIEGVFSPIGKLFIILHKICLESIGKKLSPIVYVRINAAGLTYESKLMNVNSNAPVSVKQGFLMYLPLTQTRLECVRQRPPRGHGQRERRHHQPRH